jgi:hypothetical protein
MGYRHVISIRIAWDHVRAHSSVATNPPYIVVSIL